MLVQQDGAAPSVRGPAPNLLGFFKASFKLSGNRWQQSASYLQVHGLLEPCAWGASYCLLGRVGAGTLTLVSLPPATVPSLLHFLSGPSCCPHRHLQTLLASRDTGFARTFDILCWPKDKTVICCQQTRTQTLHTHEA